MSSAIAISPDALLLGIIVFACLLLVLVVRLLFLRRCQKSAAGAFDTLFSCTEQALLLLDRSGHIVRANGAARALFHAGSEGFGETPFRALLADSDLAVEDPWDLARLPDKPLSCVFLRPEDQSRVHARVDFQLLRFEDQDFLLATISDLSEIRRTLSCQARLYAMYENGCQGFAVLQAGIFVYANTMFERFCGLQGVQLGEQSAQDIFHPQDRAFAWDELTQGARCDQSSRCFVCRLERQDTGNPVARELWVRVTALCMQWEERPALFCFFTDISAQKQLEAMRTRLQPLEQTECREPLEDLIGLPRSILLQGGLAPEQEQQLQSMEQAGYMLLRTLRPLEEYRLEAGARVLAPGPVELTALLQKVAEDFEAQETGESLGMSVEMDGSDSGGAPIWISGEGLLLYQLFRECLQAAYVGVVPGSTLRGTVTRESGAAVVAFVFRTETPLSLPLSGPENLARLHKGELRTRKTGKDETTLTVRLPLFQGSEEAGETLSNRLPLVAPWPCVRLLLATADPELVQACKMQLKHLSYIVELATDGTQAVAQCRTRRYDLVCMDMRMGDGLQAVQQLRRMEQENGGDRVPVVALVAVNGDPGDRSYLEVGCQAVLPHPVDTPSLLALIKRFTG